MPKPPDSTPTTASSSTAVNRGQRDVVERLLDAVIWRLRARHGLGAAAWGLAGCAVALAAARLAGTTAQAAVVIGIVAAGVSWAAYASRTEGRRTRQAAALRVEARNPELRNLLVTAEELLPESRHLASYMKDRVFADAARRVAPIDPRRVVPLTAASVTAVLALCSLGVAFRVHQARVSEQVAPAIAGVAEPARPSDGELVVEIRPPAYTGRPLARLQNPSTIQAMAGSQMQLRIAPMGANTTARIRMNGIALAVRRDGTAAVADAELTESGYLAVDGAGRERRLIPLSVVPDRAPEVRIVAPARDMRMDSASGTIAIEATAQDDLGLASMEIRYTRISGTGEQFEFHEGTFVASVERQTDRDWRARTRLSLPDLKLEPGDALVYRAVARDKRPDEAGLGTSDTYFVEIAAPGDVALAGFDMPPDRERYVLSQQMIVLKIERLLARERSISKAAVQEADAAIAAEQRAVRANFLFLLGGGVEDEEQEAETSTDILEGRFENRARQEILAATRLMTRAEQALSAAATALALPPAREAAQALQRAFGHSRYLLRALPSRARIDPARRLTGDRSSAIDWLRGLAITDVNAATQAAQTALADLVRISAEMPTDQGAGGMSKLTSTDPAEELTALAERILRIEPSAADLLQSSRQILAARQALAKRDVAAARAALDAAAGPVVARAQRDRLTARPTLPDLDRLAGALSSEGKR
jgi:hypothetical protein